MLNSSEYLANRDEEQNAAMLCYSITSYPEILFRHPPVSYSDQGPFEEAQVSEHSPRRMPVKHDETAATHSERYIKTQFTF